MGGETTEWALKNGVWSKPVGGGTIEAEVYDDELVDFPLLVMLRAEVEELTAERDALLRLLGVAIENERVDWEKGCWQDWGADGGSTGPTRSTRQTWTCSAALLPWRPTVADRTHLCIAPGCPMLLRLWHVACDRHMAMLTPRQRKTLRHAHKHGSARLSPQAAAAFAAGDAEEAPHV